MIGGDHGQQQAGGNPQVLQLRGCVNYNALLTFGGLVADRFERSSSRLCASKGKFAMRNPLKKLFGFPSSGSKSSKVTDRNVPTVRGDVDLYGELYNVWPDGTWNMPGFSNRKQMDDVARSVLLSVAALETYLAESAGAGRMLNPGFYSRPDAIERGWKPSEKIFKEVFANRDWDVGIMHYMTGQLTHMRKMLP
jgi:hypothetical protein